MLDENQKYRLTDLVHDEIAGICQLYGVNLHELNKKEKEMLVVIFQSGVSFIENFKKEEISKGIEALQSPTTKGNKKDE